MSISPVEVQQHLKGVDFPARGEDLAAVAERNEAPGEVIEELRDLGEQEFRDPSDVMHALGGELGDEDVGHPGDEIFEDSETFGPDDLADEDEFGTAI